MNCSRWILLGQTSFWIVSFVEYPFWHCAAKGFSLAVCPLNSNSILSNWCRVTAYKSCSFKTKLFLVVLLCGCLISSFPQLLDLSWSVSCPFMIGNFPWEPVWSQQLTLTVLHTNLTSILYVKIIQIIPNVVKMQRPTGYASFTLLHSY